ncbi:MAG: phosphopyruvate hydratase [Planctomycetes bacterium]|nr:phosphopyruvate hydratase [Planctomycetota bacterium]
MTIIQHIDAREIYDSRGRPTVEVELHVHGCAQAGRALVPSGASTGRFEALELRDGDRGRLDGLGVRKALTNVRGEIAAALIGMDALDQHALDRRLCELDGTPSKARLGANAILGVSLAAAHATAQALRIPLVERLEQIWQPHAQASPAPARLLPLPMVNMISGGLHAGGNLDIQDVLVLPVGSASFRQAFEWCVQVYTCLGRTLTAAGYEGRLVGDEGGYGPQLDTGARAIELVVEAIEAAGFRPGGEISVGLDVAATHFYHDGRYRLAMHGAGSRRNLDAGQLIDELCRWVDAYPIVSIEDGLAVDVWDGWRVLTERLGERVQLIGDDLFVTNPARLRRGIEANVANSVLVKPNQIGTLTETLETLALAMAAGYRPVISARSGETEDSTIADLAVATGAGQIKIGSVVRSERLAKYNQLLRLEETLPGTQWIGGRVLRG